MFIKDEFHYLNVSRVGTFTVYDIFDCTFECLSNPLCFSVNMATSKGANGVLWCELLSSDRHRNPEDYGGNKSSHHFSIVVRFFFSSLIRRRFSFTIEIMMANEHKTALTQLQYLQTRGQWQTKYAFFPAVALFVLAVSKWRYLSAELQTRQV